MTQQQEAAALVEPVAWRWKHRSMRDWSKTTTTTPDFTDPDITYQALVPIDTITALTARVAKAEERAHYAEGTKDLTIKHRDAAERALATARADAFEYAEKIADQYRGVWQADNIAAAIRAASNTDGAKL